MNPSPVRAATASASSVAIVVVSYNGVEDTRDCLASLRRLTGVASSIFLVDQASEDGTAALVRREFPEVTVLESGLNDGYGAGANRGLTAALSTDAEFVLLLNNDVTVAPDMLERLLHVMHWSRKIGIAGPAMLRADDPNTLWSGGGMLRGAAHSFLWEAGTPAERFSGFFWDVGFVVGCGMLFRRAVLEQVGLFDAAYFLFYEDADLCTRARRAKWRIVTVPEARLWHRAGRQTGKNPSATLYYMRRNALYYLARHSDQPGRDIAKRIVETLRLSLVWWVRGETPKARMALRALWDYRRGRMGRLDAGPAGDRK